MRIPLLFLGMIGIVFGQAGTAPVESVVGHWQGTLRVGGAVLRIALHVEQAADGLSATLDSLDQNAKGIPVNEISMQAGVVRFRSQVAHASYEGTLANGTLKGEFTQGSTVPLTLVRVERVELPGRPQEPKEPFPYRVEDVRIPGGDAVLSGTLTIPAGQGPFPSVVLVSGAGVQDRDGTYAAHKPFWVLADALTRRGIMVLRVDDRGMLALAESTADVLSSVAFLKARPEAHADKIGLVGHGEGGLVTAMAGGRSPDVAFVAALAAPGVSGEERLYSQAEAVGRVCGFAGRVGWRTGEDPAGGAL
jgi:uncharacterized protein